MEQKGLLENQKIKAEIKINDIVIISKLLAEKIKCAKSIPATVHSIKDPGSGPFAIVELKKKTQSLSARVLKKIFACLVTERKGNGFYPDK